VGEAGDSAAFSAAARSHVAGGLSSLAARGAEESRRRSAYASDEAARRDQIGALVSSLAGLRVAPAAAGAGAVPEAAGAAAPASPRPPVVPLRLALSREELERVHAAWGSVGGEREELAEGHRLSCTRHDMRTLRPGAWMNDEVVNMFGLIAKAWSLQRPGSPKVYMPYTHFWTKLSGDKAGVYDFPGVSRWTTRAKVDIFACDFVVVPRNVSNSHWACVVLDMRARTATYLDSLGASGADACATVLRWVADEHADKKGAALDMRGWRVFGTPATLPRQRNGIDCGAFLCLNLYYALQGCFPTEEDYSQAQMDQLRAAIGLTILTQKMQVVEMH